MGARWIAKGSKNHNFRHDVEKNGRKRRPGTVQEKVYFSMEVLLKNERPGEVKSELPFDACGVLKGFGYLGIVYKMHSKMGSKMNEKWRFGRPWVGFSIFLKVSGGARFLFSSDLPEVCLKFGERRRTATKRHRSRESPGCLPLMPRVRGSAYMVDI